MAAYGYGLLKDRTFVGFERELADGAWKDIDISPFEALAKDNAALLLSAPQLVIWKIRLQWAIASVLNALSAPGLAELDARWDAAQRRLFHRIAIGVDDENRQVREAADRLRAALLAGNGVAQTQLDYEAEVDFGRGQMALSREGGALHADAKRLKLGEALSEVEKTTEALAAALGRGTGEKRKPPSRQLKEAVAECAASFNAVHEELAWFIAHTPAGSERDALSIRLAPLEALLTRGIPVQEKPPQEPPAPAGGSPS